jgi:adenylate cyclase class 2
MPAEIEAKFLDADHEAMRIRLKDLGATCTHPNRLMKRSILDFPDRSIRKMGGWVRVRDEGNKITLTYKQLNERSITGMQEVEVEVDDFERTRALLHAVGLKSVAYQETKRESWELDGVEIELDEWPWIRPFIEVEAHDEAAVWRVIDKLGLDREQACYGSVEIAYQAEYNVTEEEVNRWERVTFTPVPAWLAEKEKQV